MLMVGSTAMFWERRASRSNPVASRSHAPRAVPAWHRSALPDQPGRRSARAACARPATALGTRGSPRAACRSRHCGSRGQHRRQRRAHRGSYTVSASRGERL